MSIKKNRTQSKVKKTNQNTNCTWSYMDIFVFAPFLYTPFNTLISFTVKFIFLIYKFYHAVNIKVKSYTNLWPYCKQKSKKSIVVFDSDAIVNPWTVMIKSLYTNITNCTVSTSRWSYHFAFWTQISRIDVS